MRNSILSILASSLLFAGQQDSKIKYKGTVGLPPHKRHKNTKGKRRKSLRIRSNRQKEKSKGK